VWCEVMYETFGEVSHEKFIFRAFDDDVLTSNTFRPGPLREGLDLVEDLQSTLRVVSGLSIEESRVSTFHSPRTSYDRSFGFTRRTRHLS
jgi:hypothetical protein